MSQAIKEALGNLDMAIDRMEVSLARRPARSARGGNQPDLFATLTSSNVIGFDRNQLARKLDTTIARVEELLREA